ncbi:hypothetical protein OVA26_13800 [Microbacterium sp. SL62]|uniref:hypothetical protein n=1 Tax=Microbacterium sp. SL62 TaxID=2995139 RepID=UPI002274CC83|nr:hypothetical protein [Microbacterium sp. SL62]MCY1718011.1 hypothetical protein [Microbacterium sp. SL62]
MTRNMKRLGWAAASATVALTASGLLAPAAFAGDDQTVAPTSGAAFDASAKQLLSANDDVQAVGKDGNGNVVVVTTDASALDGESGAISKRSANVVVKEVAAELTSFADSDVVGGAGYYAEAINPADLSGFCSIGFTGFDKAGNPAVISAGHCEGDGARKVTQLTLPTSDDAGGAGTKPTLTYDLGSFAFAQWGGPGNTTEDTTTSAVDISVIDVANPALDLLPVVTDWTTASSEDLSLSTRPVKAVGKAQIGAFSKSGRTTGFTDGEVSIVDGWARVGGRSVYGFGGQLKAGPGDSGGAVIQGSTAVGVVSGGDEASGFFWAADLQAGLALTNGYSVALDIDEPALTAPTSGGTVGLGGTISGTAPVNTTVEVDPATGETFTIPVDGAGNWSFAAPDELGPYKFSLTAFSGYSRSAAVAASVDVRIAAPMITSPSEDAFVINELTSISGTGLVGATVTVTGGTSESATERPTALELLGTAVVDAAGNWSIPVDLSYGNYLVSAVQARDSQTSATSEVKFIVGPPEPTIDGIQDGANYSGAAVPTSISGTGVDGAEILVTLNGAEVGRTTVRNGVWSVQLGVLAEGSYEIAATQTIGGVANGVAVNFAVVPAAVPSPSATPGPAGNGGGLANTGMGDVAPLAWGALVLLLGGIGALGFRSLRRASR